MEHRNDVICRKIINSANTNCLGTWTLVFRDTFIWTSHPDDINYLALLASSRMHSKLYNYRTSTHANKQRF